MSVPDWRLEHEAEKKQLEGEKREREEEINTDERLREKQGKRYVYED